MTKKKQDHYYRIYDDEEKFNYFRSMYQAEKIRKMLKKYEVAHQEYHNAAFVDFLKKYDPKAELIEVARISDQCLGSTKQDLNQKNSWQQASRGVLCILI